VVEQCKTAFVITGAESVSLRYQTPSVASREKTRLELCNEYMVVMIIRYGYTAMDNYELECGARRDAKPRIGTIIR
jgi:hypothetical protein